MDVKVHVKTQPHVEVSHAIELLRIPTMFIVGFTQLMLLKIVE
jgi:hypothetical protein